MMLPGAAVGWRDVTAVDVTERLGLDAATAGPRVDPYLLWAQATGFIDVGGAAGAAGAGPPDWFSVMIEVSSKVGTAARFAEQAAAYADWIRVPPAYRTPPASLGESRFCTARVTHEFFRQLESHELLVDAVERVILGAPVRAPAPSACEVDAESAPVDARPANTHGAAAPRDTFVAVIDDRFAFAHHRLRIGTKTRLAAYWNQEDVASTTQGFGYGIELSRTRIDDLLARCRTVDGRIDEHAVYRAVGLMPELGRRAAHGSHVLDFAAGVDSRHASAAPQLICVDLPRHVTEDTSGRALPVLVLDALRYVVKRADGAASAGAPLPHVVVNLSYGMIAGPHDGSSFLERAIDELIALREQAGAKLEVVIPSGNFRLSRCHADFKLSAITVERPLRWRLQPDDATASFVELWLPDAAAGVRIQVTSPDGHVSPWIGVGQMATLHASSHLPVCTIVYPTRGAIGDNPMILVATAPTVPRSRPRPVASAGTWQIRFEADDPSVRVRAWIQRDDFVFGYPLRGRQSRFEDPGCYQMFDVHGRLKVEDDEGSVIRRVDTLNAIGTGKRVRVVGGLRLTGGLPVDGPPDPDRYEFACYASVGANGGVEFAETCEDSDASPGRLAAGTRSGCFIAMNGTSVAAPQYTRRVARWLMTDPPTSSPPPGSATDTPQMTGVAR